MATENKFDWTKFTIRTPLKTTPEKIFKAWTTSAGLEDWFLSLAKFTSPEGKVRKPKETIRKNDTYEWQWHGYADVMEKGKILETNGRDYLRFSFGEPGNVTVKIVKQGDETILELTQEDIPHFDTTKSNYHVECANGWTFYLANLKSMLQGGIDLRNKNGKLNMD